MFVTIKACAVASAFIILMTKTLRVGMIGYGFMGKAHSNAWRQVSHFFPLEARP